MKSKRERLCQSILKLPTPCAIEDVNKLLDPILDNEECSNATTGCSSNEVTPLIVACDRANTACLTYFQNKLAAFPSLKFEIGEPSDQSPGEENTAMHHAAMSGCIPAISILAKMERASVMSLGRAQNSHNDTPLMMAVTFNRFDFLKEWCHLVQQDKDSDCGLSSIKEALEMQNNSKDSCLSLACGHGHLVIVQFLLSPICNVAVDSDTIMKCQTIYDRMELALRRNPSLSVTHKEQTAQVHLCLQELQTEVARVSQLTAKELLESECSLLHKHDASFKKSKGKRKKKHGRRASMKHSSSSEKLENRANNDIESRVQLKTLSDGTRAVVVKGHTDNDRFIQTPISSQLPSADEMFRDRFEQATISAEVDSVMQALCLEMSMLLYTSHGMAINLSPSQLDAVQGILEKQMVAVEDARNIQHRLHKTSEKK